MSPLIRVSRERLSGVADSEQGRSAGAPVVDTLSVLFTDLVASTEMRERLGDDAAEVVRRQHDQLIAEVAEGHGGHVVKHLGDGFLVTFRSAARAVAAAVEMQQGLELQARRDPNEPLAIRIGISAGDVTLEDGDVFGTPVVEAARLCDAAEGGQVLAADVVHVLAGGRGDHHFEPVGALELKGLTKPVAACAVAWEPVARTEEASLPFPRPLTLPDGSFPFRGRDEELEQILGVWKRVQHDRARACVLFAGEPGVGKTRLASELARRVHDDGAAVLFGRCDEDLGVPFQPFVEALQHQLANLAQLPSDEAVASLGPSAGHLARLAPELPERVPGVVVPAPSGNAEEDRFRMFEAVDGWLAAESSASGLLLVLDDVHWAAAPTLLLLRHLLLSSSPAPLLVLAPYRDTDLDRSHPLAELLADLRRVANVERLALGGLDRAGIVDLMVAVAGHDLEADGQELADAVYEETEGNPFFVGELLRHLAESGGLIQDGGRWVASVPVSELSLPDGIREVVGRRLSRLSDDANDVLAWGAVIGRDLRLDLLARVAGGEDRCLDALDAAVDARLVDEAGVGRWRFAHALVRSTLLAELRTTRRTRMHLAVGEACEQVAPDDVAMLAQQFAEAAPLGAADRAVTYLLAAGDLALAQLAFDQAQVHYQRAIDVMEDVGFDSPELRAEALAGLVIALRWNRGDHDPVLDELCALSLEIGDGSRLARSLLESSRGYFRIAFAVDEVSVARLETCLALLPEGDSAERALVTALLAGELHFGGDLERMDRLSTDAVEMATRLEDAGVLFMALNARSSVLQHPDALAERRLVVEAAERLAGRAPEASFLTLGMKIAQAAYEGDAERYREGVREFEGHAWSNPSQRWSSTFFSAGYELSFGNLERAEQLGQEMLRQSIEANEPDGVLFAGNVLGFCYRQQGRLDEAIAMFPEEYWHINEVLTIVALDRCEAERYDEVRADLPMLFDAWRVHHADLGLLPTSAALAFVVVELGATDEAQVLLERMEPWSPWWSTWGGLASLGPVSLAIARLRALLGDVDGSEQAFDESIARCRASGSRYFLAESLLYLGLARADRGEAGERVGTPLREAVQLANEGGYGTILRRGERALANLR